MRTFCAYIKKECMEMLRTGKFYLVMILFVLFGIMSPALAKLTPWLMEQMSETLEESGMVVSAVAVDALTSWTQFYKNIPMALLVFVLVFAGILAGEYQKGTLVLSVSKGASRTAVLAAKTVTLLGVWTLGFTVCYGITIFYTEFYWDNSIVQNCLYGAFCYWLFGVNVLAFLVLVSTIAETVSMVLLGTAAYVGAQFLLMLFPKAERFLPIKLTEGMTLAAGGSQAEEYIPAVLVTVAMTVGAFLASRACIGKKKL